MKKSLVTILIILSIFSGLVLPNTQKAEAQGYPVFDYTRFQNWLVDEEHWIAENALKIAMAEVMHQMTQAVVNWIDSGFKGNPAFITDTKQFLQDTADITIGDLVQGRDLEFLCDPFKIQVRLALGLQYRPFKDKIRCSFTSISGNVKDAMNKFTDGDFIGGGGWDSWLQLTTVPQNNYFGALLISQNELDIRLSGSKEVQLAEANWGGGFMSWKECKTKTTSTGDTTGDGVYVEGTGGSVTSVDAITGATTTGRNASLGRTEYYNTNGDVAGTVQESQDCTIQTPGSVLSNKLNWADTSDIRKTELANDVNAIASALINQLVHNLTDGLLKRGSGQKRTSTAYQDNQTYLSSLQATLDSQRTAQNNTNNNGNRGNYSNITPNGDSYSDPTYASKTNALGLIDTLLNIQSQFLAAQNNMSSILNTARTAFAEADCTQSSSGATMSTNAVAQIEGIINYDKTIYGNLPWNKVDVRTATSTVMSSQATLNADRETINATNDATLISQTIQGLADVPLYTSAQVASFTGNGQTITDVRDWITLKRSNISAAGCVIQ